MKIQGVTEVKGVMFVLDIEEAMAAANQDKDVLKRIGEECAAMLKICGVDPNTGERISYRSSLLGTMMPKQLTDEGGKAKGVKISNMKTMPCPYCGKLFSTRGITRHKNACAKRPQDSDEEIEATDKGFLGRLKGKKI